MPDASELVISRSVKLTLVVSHDTEPARVLIKLRRRWPRTAALVLTLDEFERLLSIPKSATHEGSIGGTLSYTLNNSNRRHAWTIVTMIGSATSFEPFQLHRREILRLRDHFNVVVLSHDYLQAELTRNRETTGPDAAEESRAPPAADAPTMLQGNCLYGKSLTCSPSLLDEPMQDDEAPPAQAHDDVPQTLPLDALDYLPSSQPQDEPASAQPSDVEPAQENAERCEYQVDCGCHLRAKRKKRGDGPA